MNTLMQQKKRLESEIVEAKNSIASLKESGVPNLTAMNHFSEMIERNMQLIYMIDNHLSSGHQPMWRVK